MVYEFIHIYKTTVGSFPEKVFPITLRSIIVKLKSLINYLLNKAMTGEYIELKKSKKKSKNIISSFNGALRKMLFLFLILHSVDELELLNQEVANIINNVF